MNTSTSQRRFEPMVLRLYLTCSVLLLVLGAAFRVAPLLDHGGRMLWQWPTEDGYLMKTIARNIAMGEGMTVSAGLIQTNGTQPLTTFVWAGAFWLTGGDKAGGVLLIQVFQIAVSVAAAGLLYVLARRLLAVYPWGHAAAALAAGLWFASPVTINYTVNGLETGNYVALMLLTVLAWLWGETASRRPYPWFALGVGCLLGVTFLTRIDAVFFIAAVTGWHTLLGLRRGGGELRRRLGESVIMGCTSIVVASPWLIYNKVVFGSVMPISGTAQSMTARLGANAAHVPANLFEYMALVLPIPSGLTTAGIVIAVTLAAIALYGGAVWVAARRMTPEQRSVVVIGVLTLAGLVGYYGVLFGASHFMGRYLFPVSPMLAVLTVALGLAIAWRVAPRIPQSRPGAAIAAVAVLALVAGLNMRIYVNSGRGSAHDHRPVMQWVEANVPPDVWVGAIQTGVMGFFHDRTINLDGKVNPHALAARNGRGVPWYIVDTPIRYLADWHGIAGWVDTEPFRSHFELVVDDPERNVAVLRRVTPVPADATVAGRCGALAAEN